MSDGIIDHTVWKSTLEQGQYWSVVFSNRDSQRDAELSQQQSLTNANGSDRILGTATSIRRTRKLRYGSDYNVAEIMAASVTQRVPADWWSTLR